MAKKPTYEELEKQKNLFETMLTATPDIFVLKDTNFVYQAVNASFCKFIGKPSKDIIGKTDFDLFPADEAEMYRCDDEKVIKFLKPIIQDEEVTGKESKKWLHVAKTPVFDNDKKLIGILCSVRNITERKKAQEKLFASKEKYRKLFEEARDGIVLTEAETGIIIDCNPETAKLVERKKSELLGQHQRILHPQHTIIDGFSDTFIKHRDKFDGQILDAQVITSTGEIKDVAIKCNRFYLGNKKYLQGIFRDITEQKWAEEEKKKLEAQLQMSQRMEAIGTLAGGIAHDFNNLLMGIQGNTSLMFQDIDSSHPYHERLKRIEKQIQSGVKLTSQLLGYARKGRYEVIPLSLNQIVNETSDTFGQTKKEIVIHKKLAEDLFAIEADHGQIEQVLLNLFVNAADAMPRGGDFYLETKNVTKKAFKNKPYKPTADKYVLLIVKDTGIGMDKSTIEHIFEPFFTTKEMGRGTGLGLASVYGIIKAHGGYIDVESKKKHGTTFRVYLPAIKRKIKKVTKTYDEFIKGTGTVLLVDDEEVIQEVCKELLENIGYRVFSAKDGKEALKLYRKNQDKIDLVLLDMTMPNMSGSEVYDRLKEINPEVKVLLSSGYSIDGEATAILNRGCDGFIQKPFNINEMSGKIRKIL